MPVISLASPKGGAGKTTAAMLLATELSQKGLGVTVIDCDPRQWSVKWGKGGSVPEKMTIESKPTEENIIDVIDEAKSKSPFVIIDLEGTSSMLVAFAISRSDLVIIPTQAGPMEGESAADAIKLIRQQEKGMGRKIPFAVLMTRMRAAIRTKIERSLTEQLEAADIPVLSTQLTERNAFKMIFDHQCSLEELPSSTYKLDDAIANARSFAGEVISIFKAKTPKKRKQVTA